MPRELSPGGDGRLHREASADGRPDGDPAALAADGRKRNSMNRRQFFSSSGAAAVAAASTHSAEAAPTKPVLMKLGCQSAPTNEKHVGYLARYGVRDICGYPATSDGR